MRHFYRRLAPGRLYDVPVKMGWLADSTPEQKVNPVDL
jgi:ribosomal protein S12 methylthiotransferase accessory factor